MNSQIGSLRLLVTISHGIKNLKQSQVKSVAEAVDRTAEKNSGILVEDDISNWLIDRPGTEGQDFSETQTIRMDDTNAVPVSESDEERPSQEEHASEPAETEAAPDSRRWQEKRSWQTPAPPRGTRVQR